MVSDIVLVLRSEHRDLVDLAEQCGRQSRGFEDPVGRLHLRLKAHHSALERVAGTTSAWLRDEIGPITDVVELLRTRIDSPADRQATPDLAMAVVEEEESRLIPRLEDRVPLLPRRRAGRTFRMVRDGALRGSHPSSRRSRSQAELYSLARRADLKQRSRMTQVELQQAVEAWERDQASG